MTRANSVTRGWSMMGPELVLLDGQVATLDPARPFCSAIACQGGRIMAVGSDSEILPLVARKTRVIRLGGRRVTPGLIDSHLHLVSFGLVLSQIDLVGVRSFAALQRLVAERTSTQPPGTWILGRGWDQELLGALPSRRHLDAVAPHHPVMLTRTCGHIVVVNSKALEAAGISRSTPDPPGGVIDRDESGEPTGILRETAIALVRQRMPQPHVQEVAEALVAAGQHAVAAGLTSVHSNDNIPNAGPDFILEAYRRAFEMGFRLRVWWDFPGDMLPSVRERYSGSGAGDDWFRIGAAKFLADGSLGGATAALSQPYADAPGTCGVLRMDPGELALRVGEAGDAGFQVAIHAIGDRAIDVALDALERHGPWDNRQGACARPRLIHCEVMRPDLFSRMKRLGVVADLQPRFVSTDKRFAEQRLGPARASLSYACRSFLEAGIPVAFGSDCPVEPIEPILGIFAAVTRCDTDGNPPGGWYPQEKISVEAALRCFTVGGAWAVGEQDEKGTITPGKLADLVVWDRDPLGVDPQELPHLRPVLVVVGGEVAYECDATSGAG